MRQGHTYLDLSTPCPWKLGRMDSRLSRRVPLGDL
jgi:hypothetical protein